MKGTPILTLLYLKDVTDGIKSKITYWHEKKKKISEFKDKAKGIIQKKVEGKNNSQ